MRFRSREVFDQPPVFGTGPSAEVGPVAKRGRTLILTLTAASVMVIWWVALHEPAGQSYYPRCAFFESTGLECPACGATRALYAFVHGDFTGAFRCHPAVPVLIFASVARAAAAWRGCTFSPKTPVWAALTGWAAMAVFTLARNL
jgi:Protein of unknown function (DUF2752)